MDKLFSILLCVNSILLFVMSIANIKLRHSNFKLKESIRQLAYWLAAIDTKDFRSLDARYINEARKILEDTNI